MFKLRLAVVAAFLAFLAGCPTEADDLRRARAEAGDTLAPEVVEGEYACTNLRRWREDLDLPQYLQETPGNVDEAHRAEEDARRTQRQKEYIRDHDGTLVVCHHKLDKSDATRGVCSVCTEMLDNPKYVIERRVSAGEDGTTAIKLPDNQRLWKQVEFRLKFDKADCETDAAAQEKSFRDWLASRGAEQSYIDKAVELEKAKGSWTKDPQVPKLVAKYGLPPLAEPFVRCPNKACKARETSSVGLLESRCWNCNTYFTVTSRDERETQTEPLESLCPFCKNAVDPTQNYCSKCNKFFRTAERDGPCWRCGGTHVCPECGGSGKGTAPIYNGGDDCWLCGGKAGSNGVCPDCDAHGFTTYDGALPGGFSTAKRSNDDWKLSRGVPAVAAPAKKDEGE